MSKNKQESSNPIRPYCVECFAEAVDYRKNGLCISCFNKFEARYRQRLNG